MVKQTTTLSGDDAPRFNADGSARLSEIDERIEDMQARGWTLTFKSPPIVTEKRIFDHKPSNSYGAKSTFRGSETRSKVKAVMSREYEGTTGGRRNGRQRSRPAI